MVACSLHVPRSRYSSVLLTSIHLVISKAARRNEEGSTKNEGERERKRERDKRGEKESIKVLGEKERLESVGNPKVDFTALPLARKGEHGYSKKSGFVVIVRDRRTLV